MLKSSLKTHFINCNLKEACEAVTTSRTIICRYQKRTGLERINWVKHRSSSTSSCSESQDTKTETVRKHCQWLCELRRWKCDVFLLPRMYLLSLLREWIRCNTYDRGVCCMLWSWLKGEGVQIWFKLSSRWGYSGYCCYQCASPDKITIIYYGYALKQL